MALWVAGTVGQLLMSSKILEEKVDMQLAELREFMAQKRLPKGLRKRIREFMETLCECNTKALLPCVSADVAEVLVRQEQDRLRRKGGIGSPPA